MNASIRVLCVDERAAARSCAARRTERPKHRAHRRAAQPTAQLSVVGDRGRVHRKDGGDPGAVATLARGQPGHFDHQAHAGRLHAVVRQAPKYPVRGHGVTEAEHGECVLPDNVYLATGGQRHMKLARSGANYVIALMAGPSVNRHRPLVNVDVLFDSAAEVAGHNAVGVFLTGMGKDGAAGLLHMSMAGASILVQNEAS